MVNLTFEIACFMGKARAGKTLSMVANGYETLLAIKESVYYLEKKLKEKKKLTDTELRRYNLLADFKLMSNLNLNKKIFGDYTQMSAESLLEMYKEKKEIKHYLILMDDLFKTLDNRDFLKEKNKIFSYFITEIGKKENILLYVSHFENMVELRLRNFTEKFIYCQKGEFINIKISNRNLRIFKEFDNYYDWEHNTKKENEMYIQQSILRNYVNLNNNLEVKKHIVAVEYVKANKYFNMYNTGEII